MSIRIQISMNAALLVIGLCGSTAAAQDDLVHPLELAGRAVLAWEDSIRPFDRGTVLLDIEAFGLGGKAHSSARQADLARLATRLGARPGSFVRFMSCTDEPHEERGCQMTNGVSVILQIGEPTKSGQSLLVPVVFLRDVRYTHPETGAVRRWVAITSRDVILARTSGGEWVVRDLGDARRGRL
jgi:hypothetical protein